MAIVFVVTGCSNDDGYEYSDIYSGTHNYLHNEYEAPEPIELTETEHFLADIDFMMYMLEANFALMDALYWSRGRDVRAMAEDARVQVIAHENIDTVEFFRILNGTIGRLQGSAHFGVEVPAAYRATVGVHAGAGWARNDHAGIIEVLDLDVENSVYHRWFMLWYNDRARMYDSAFRSVYGNMIIQSMYDRDIDMFKRAWELEVSAQDARTRQDRQIIDYGRIDYLDAWNAFQGMLGYEESCK
jgi:hypothetical protein